MSLTTPLLVFPPGWNAYAPYLSIPLLKGFLSENGINSYTKDLNIEFYNNILSKKYLNTIYREIECKVKSSDLNDIELMARYIDALNSKNAIKEIALAKSIIRNNSFFSDKDRKYAEYVLKNAFRLIAAKYCLSFISLSKIEFEIDIKSFSDVVLISDNKEINPFIDFYNKYITDYINNMDIDFIGISITEKTQFVSAVTLVKIIRENCPNVKHITFGGNYITRIQERWGESHGVFALIDSIVVYEGELPLLKLIKAISENRDLGDVPNLVYEKNKKIVRNRIISISPHEWSMPNFDDCIKNKYFSPYFIAPIHSSRGCYNKCEFCTIPDASNGGYRYRNIDSFVCGIRHISKKYNIKHFNFIDESISIKNIREISFKIKDANIFWSCESRFSPDFLNEALSKQLYESGCRRIQLGLESYNQRILDKMNKKIKLKWVTPSLNNLFRNKIGVHLFFMIGFPGEIKRESRRTIQYCKNISRYCEMKYHGTCTVGWQPFSLEYGSGVWNNPLKHHVTFDSQLKELDLNINYNLIGGINKDDINEILLENMRIPYSNKNIKHNTDSTSSILGDDHLFLNMCCDDYQILRKKESVSLDKWMSCGHVYKVYFKNKIHTVEYLFSSDEVDVSCFDKEESAYSKSMNLPLPLKVDPVNRPLYKNNNKVLIWNWYFKRLNRVSLKVFNILYSLQGIDFVKIRNESSLSSANKNMCLFINDLEKNKILTKNRLFDFN